MFLKKYFIHSCQYGLGVFSAEPIPKGAKIYQCNNFWMSIMPIPDIEKLPKAMKEPLTKYVYDGGGIHKLDNAVYYNIDDGRFMNHSENPNITWDEKNECYWANKDINIDEEITCNYSDFCTKGKYCFNF